MPKSRGHGFGMGALLCGVVFAPIAAGILWFVGHPQVRIDNTGTEALQIWLDGKKLTVVPANTNGASPPSVFVGHGKHTYGYSKVGATAPEGTTDGDTTVNDAHLYNPQATGCYWLTADAYGSASVMGVQKGPQPVKEFYSFDQVNTWFGQNPDEIEVSNGETGGKRVAINRWTACMDLEKKGCDATARNQYVTCAQAAMSANNKAAFDKCREAAPCAATPAPAHGAAASAHNAATPHGGEPHGEPHAAPGGHPPPHPTAAPPKK